MSAIKKRFIVIFAILILVVIAAVIVIVCTMKPNNSHHEIKTGTDFEKEYFKAFKEQDYDTLYALMYEPYLDAVAKEEGIPSMKSNVTDYYKFLNEKVTYEYGNIKNIKQKLSTTTDLKQEELDSVNQEFAYLGLEEKVHAGVHISLIISYECEKETADVDFEYYAIEVGGQWYFYNFELAPIYTETTGAAADGTTDDEGQDASDGKEHSIEFILDYGTEQEKVILTKEDIKRAEAVVSDSNVVREYIVQLQFTEKGTGIFAEETAANIGKKITIVCDGEVILEPTISAAIDNGVTYINDFDSMEDAQSFADKLK
ncbi:MAG: hypothetical protein PUB54_05410 [Lachnospiraceae bacterium]|nr:hypothetical protein [Lachnospiraceae bacterium]